MGERLRFAMALVILAAAILGCGEKLGDGSNFAPPPSRPEAERMKERGFTKEEIESRANLPR